MQNIQNPNLFYPLASIKSGGDCRVRKKLKADIFLLLPHCKNEHGNTH